MTSATDLTKIHPGLLLTIADGAALTGFSVRTMERYVADGIVPAVYVGPRAVRIRAGDLAALVRPRPAMPGAPLPLALARGVGRAR